MSTPINTNSSLFSDIPRVYGSLLSNEQKNDMKQKGENFYKSIDFEKYHPKIEETNPMGDLLDLSETENLVEQILYKRLLLAIRSGLSVNDLTEEEKESLRVHSCNEEKN